MKKGLEHIKLPKEFMLDSSHERIFQISMEYIYKDIVVIRCEGV